MNRCAEEYYVVRVAERDYPSTERAATFVGEDGTVGALTDARRFSSLRSAEQYIAAQGTRRQRFLVQRCSREPAVGERGPMQELVARLMEIPPPYRRSAYNWFRGKDVAALLRRQGEDTYQRHRRALLDYAIDLSRPSTVVLLRRKSRRITINTGDRPVWDGPRQYLAAPSQRPSAPPAPEGTDDD